ncbi:hypothetical protein Hanom_Chr09g00854811 [Helianthus anomalus]
MTRGSKTYIPKNFYRTGGSKTYIPKNFYTRTTYITLLSEKFGGSGAPPRPLYHSPLITIYVWPTSFLHLMERKTAHDWGAENIPFSRPHSMTNGSSI